MEKTESDGQRATGARRRERRCGTRDGGGSASSMARHGRTPARLELQPSSGHGMRKAILGR